MYLQHNIDALLYCRRSPDEYDNDSVENQAMMLRKYAKDNGFRIVDVYQNNEYRGMTFDRPDFERMMRDLRTKRGNVVIVKDLSRLGREHIRVDTLRELEFPQMNVRLIAVADNYDGAHLTHTANSMAQVKGLFNEWHAAEASVKVRDVFKAKREAGQFISTVPHGYKRNPVDRHRLIVDEEAAAVIRRIFNMAITGDGYERIAKILANEKVLTPTAYAGHVPRTKNTTPYDWYYSTIRTILHNETYLGHTVQGRCTRISYKVKTVVNVPKEQWVRVENTHEPIISQGTWDMAQGIIHKRKRPTKKGEPHIFVGMLKCSDCDSALAKGSKGNLSCHRYKTQGKGACTNHHITMERLCITVLASIRAVSAEIREDRAGFIERLSGIEAKQKQREREAAGKAQGKVEKRLGEIPALIKAAFEKNATGVLPDDLFTEMMVEYKREREELTAKLDTLNAIIHEAEEKASGINEFVGLIEKYIDIEVLDRALVHELIEKIVVHQTVKVSGQRTQQVDIYYRFLGKIF